MPTTRPTSNTGKRLTPAPIMIRAAWDTSVSTVTVTTRRVITSATVSGALPAVGGSGVA